MIIERLREWARVRPDAPAVAWKGQIFSYARFWDLIRGARLLVGVDTGITHLGVAMGAPTLALFGSTCPYLRAPEGRLQVVYLPRPCSPCRRNPTCGGRFDCMREIDVDRVAAAVDGLQSESCPARVAISRVFAKSPPP